MNISRALRAAALAAAFAAGCASKPAPAPPPPPAPVVPPASELARSGLAVVQTADVVLRDSSRNRDVPVRVTYPEGGGPFPVVVFSHGASGSSRTNDALLRFWATHNFVVLAPAHTDTAPGGTAKDTASEDGREPAAEAAADPKGWESRARDLAFVAAATGAVEAKMPALKGKLDDARIGVGGQSYGAFSAMLLAGATVEVSKKEKARSFADPIAKAFLLISPPGKGQQGLADKSWAAVDRPLMVLTGTRDQGVKNQDPSWRLDAYQLSPPGGKYAVFIQGASHLSLTGLSAEPGAPPPRPTGKKTTSPEAEIAIFNDVKAATLAFWQAYLTGDGSAKAFLQSDALMTDSENRAQLLRR